jgi:hypothetical protein
MKRIEDAYRRFSKERFPVIRESQLSQIEKRIGIIFPGDYREYLLQFNGGYFKNPEITPVGEGCPVETLQSLFGIGASHPTAELATDALMALFDDNDPPKIVPIGDTGVGGLIVLVTEAEDRGTILLKQAFGRFYYLADDIEDFFGLLREPAWG